MRILVIDDDHAMRASLGEFIRAKDFEVNEARDGSEGLALAAKLRPGMILLDQVLPETTGLDLLPRLRSLLPATQVVMLTGAPLVRDAVQAVQLGAVNYLEKPPDLARLGELMQACRRAEESRAALDNAGRFRAERIEREFLLMPDPAMERVYRDVKGVAGLDRITVLIQGETGSGKEHVARLVHHLSKRDQGPFIELHCGAVPESLLESELFGYEPGAFTGAGRAKPGLFEVAGGGTLFLDEVGEMPLGIQVKLLKVLEERRIRRLGGTQEIKLDARVVAATNRDLGTEVRVGRFRQDLFYRLNGYTIEIPGLRERAADIPVLARHFLAEACREVGLPAPDLTERAQAMLGAHIWPGNVRELKNVMVRLAIESRQAGSVQWGHLDGLLHPASPWGQASLPLPESSMDAVERQAIVSALQRHGGNRSAAARALGISRKTLFNKLKRWENLGHPMV